MADVYEHSAITLAAACSLNSHDGFLHQRRQQRLAGYSSDTVIGNSVGLESDSPTSDVFVLPCPESWPVNRTVVLQSSYDSPFPQNIWFIFINKVL
jgi:hypothetical protein